MKTQSVWFTAFLPVPELVTRSDSVREPLRFLSSRDDVWRQFEAGLRGEPCPSEKVFVRGYSRLRWPVAGQALKASLHQLRLSREHGMRCRVPIPVVAKKHWEESSDKANLSLTEYVRLYPTLFAEVRLVLSPMTESSIPVHLQEEVGEGFRDRLQDIRRRISLALFGDPMFIYSSFSNYFTLNVCRSGISPHAFEVARGQYGTTVRAEGNTYTVQTDESASHLFVDRLVDSACLALAQRVVVPVLWSQLKTTPIEHAGILTELLECVALCHRAKYFIHSSKLEPHFLSNSYQRRMFEFVARALGLDSVEADLRKAIAGWLQSIPVMRAMPLLECSEPLRAELMATLRRLTSGTKDLDLKPPTGTVFRYLVLAYLRDGILSHWDPQRFLVPNEDIGRRSVHSIQKGVLGLEAGLEKQERVDLHDLYPVPGRILQTLTDFGLVSPSAIRRTRARVAFRANSASTIVAEACTEALATHTKDEIIQLGA